MEAIKLSVGKQGRIVIPANLRRQLAIEPGSQLLVHIEDGRLIMETKKQLWETVHDACDAIKSDRDLGQELIEERRSAAQKENA